MKVNGTDSLIKLFLELNNQNLKTPTPGEKVNIENLPKQVIEILIQRDEVILRGDLILKPEIQFTRQLHETPEAYLQRISSEMIKMKESQNGIQEEQMQLLRANEGIVDIALKSGLHKELVDQNRLKKSIPSDAKEIRWLLIFSVSLMAVLIIYLIFRK